MTTKIGLVCAPADEGPAYAHDCEQCRYAGQVSALPFGRTVNAADVYLCANAATWPYGTMVIRLSSDPADYWSEQQPLDRWRQNSTSRDAAELLRQRGLINFAPAEKPTRRAFAA